MKKLLDPDGKLMTLIGILGDHCLLSLLWLACAIPVITVGAASAAMCKLSFRLQNGQECSILKDGFRAVKQYFKPATKLWLAALAVALVFVLDVHFSLQLPVESQDFAAVVLGMIGLIGLVFALCLLWLYPALLHFEGNFLHNIKLAFLLGVMHLGWSALMLVLDAALLLASLFATFLIPFLPGLITLVNTFCIRRALGKYIRSEQPEEDAECE